MDKADIPVPSKEVVETLMWALGAAVNEFYVSRDDHSDVEAAEKWLVEVDAIVCGDPPSPVVTEKG